MVPSGLASQVWTVTSLHEHVGPGKVTTPSAEAPVIANGVVLEMMPAKSQYKNFEGMENLPNAAY